MAAESLAASAFFSKVVNERGIRNFNCVVESRNAVSRAVQPEAGVVSTPPLEILYYGVDY
jgi:hypothetical protein